MYTLHDNMTINSGHLMSRKGKTKIACTLTDMSSRCFVGASPIKHLNRVTKMGLHGIATMATLVSGLFQLKTTWPHRAGQRIQQCACHWYVRHLWLPAHWHHHTWPVTEHFVWVGGAPVHLALAIGAPLTGLNLAPDAAAICYRSSWSAAAGQVTEATMRMIERATPASAVPLELSPCMLRDREGCTVEKAAQAGTRNWKRIVLSSSQKSKC